MLWMASAAAALAVLFTGGAYFTWAWKLAFVAWLALVAAALAIESRDAARPGVDSSACCRPWRWRLPSQES